MTLDFPAYVKTLSKYLRKDSEISQTKSLDFLATTAGFDDFSSYKNILVSLNDNLLSSQSQKYYACLDLWNKLPKIAKFYGIQVSDVEEKVSYLNLVTKYQKESEFLCPVSSVSVEIKNYLMKEKIFSGLLSLSTLLMSQEGQTIIYEVFSERGYIDIYDELPFLYNPDRYLIEENIPNDPEVCDQIAFMCDTLSKQIRAVFSIKSEEYYDLYWNKVCVSWENLFLLFDEYSIPSKNYPRLIPKQRRFNFHEGTVPLQNQ